MHDLKVHLNTTKKKCTSSEISINLSFYVYIIPKETNIIASNSNLKKKKNDHWLKFENWPLKIYIRIIKHYTDIDPTVNTRPHISCI